MPTMNMPATIPLKAGKIIFFKFNTNGTLTKNAANACMNNGTVASITVNRTFNTSELPDGNSQFPMGVYDTGVVEEYTVNMSSFQPAVHALLSGEDIEEKETDTMTMVEVEKTIDAAAYTVTLNPVYDGTGIVLAAGKDGSDFEKVSADPAAGEFMVSAGLMTFNSADAGKEILVTYDYATAATMTGELPEAIKRPALHAIISTETTDEKQINAYRSNIVIDCCKATGSLSRPPLQDEAAGWSYTLRVLKPRGGFPPVYTKHELAPVS
ncbi:MAG: hypothetical protein HPY66_1648 [Firmicutes bacterium]|nr:hypothetical protein [Bacillota bacterium]